MVRLERATREVLPRAGEVAWLLRQSLYSHWQRLAMLHLFGVPERVLDVGAGTGALSLDLGWLLGNAARITAVDNDQTCLDLLRELGDRLEIEVQGLLGSVYDLPVDADSQDLTVSRFLFQHLAQPERALEEMVRVTAPGGRVAVIAVDDDAGVAQPPPDPALQRAYDAIAELQSRRGGNRRVGRHLYRMMRDAGLAELQVTVMPRVRLGTYHGRSGELEEHQREFLRGYRSDLLAEDLMTEAQFASAMDALECSFTQERFEFLSEFLAVGRVPD